MENIPNFYIHIISKINDSTLTRDMAVEALEITDSLLSMLKGKTEEGIC